MDHETIPIKQLRCPRCNKPVIFERDDTLRCEDCGKLYFDNWLGIYRVDKSTPEDISDSVEVRL